MDTIIVFTPCRYVLGAWLMFLVAVRAYYPQPTVEIKPAGNMTSFHLLLPDGAWKEDDRSFFNAQLETRTLSSWQLKDA